MFPENDSDTPQVKCLKLLGCALHALESAHRDSVDQLNAAFAEADNAFYTAESVERLRARAMRITGYTLFPGINPQLRRGRRVPSDLNAAQAASPDVGGK